ncbi:unnamed protein product [Adineta ricciae]|uniref:Uncharacterized protein n=1 Tax=Adineta ricciae TaxID=249248 RepID=A0A813PBV7_ADIRI|nr:unnamed protein product [Adineta ricciae]
MLNSSFQKRKSRSLECLSHNSLLKNAKCHKSYHLSLMNLERQCHFNDVSKNRTNEQQKHDNQAGKEQKQQQICPRRRSIIKTSDIPRSTLKKSVTFASLTSVFDLPENEYEIDPSPCHHKTIIGKDFVIIIRNRHHINDDTITVSDIFHQRSQS